MERVIVTWDRNGKFFQIWGEGYKGDGIAHGKRIAEQIGGTYKVVEPPFAEMNAPAGPGHAATSTPNEDPPSAGDDFQHEQGHDRDGAERDRLRRLEEAFGPIIERAARANAEFEAAVNAISDPALRDAVRKQRVAF